MKIFVRFIAVALFAFAVPVAAEAKLPHPLTPEGFTMEKTKGRPAEIRTWIFYDAEGKKAPGSREDADEFILLRFGRRGRAVEYVTEKPGRRGSRVELDKKRYIYVAPDGRRYDYWYGVKRRRKSVAYYMESHNGMPSHGWKKIYSEADGKPYVKRYGYRDGELRPGYIVFHYKDQRLDYKTTVAGYGIPEHEEYRYLDFDRKGNWTERIEIRYTPERGVEYRLAVREIVY